MNIVRQSKFRHVYAKPMKQEFLLNDVRITKISWESLFAVVNPKFLAVITEGSGGPFVVFPLSKVGRVEKDYPIVDAHRAPCLEIAWSPFNDNIIASCSEDATAKVWQIPDGGLRSNLSEPIVELLGHQKRVSNIVWHPSANSVLLTAGGDQKILIWNVGTGEALIEIAGHPDLVWSVAFNYDGSKIVTTCKDRRIRIIDPRSGKIIQQGMGHEGVKPQRAIFLKDGRIFTTGFTKRSERMYALRTEEALEEPIIQEELDTSNGVLYPLYDQDTGLVYLGGKGDCAIRYYEINYDPPFVHYINVHGSSEPQRGLAFMPKRGLSATENEIARIYKCTNKGLVEVIQFYVPRKSELFQDDLYPDTATTTPAISAEEWMSGKNADPVLAPVSPGNQGTKAAETKPRAKVANILAQMPTTPPTTAGSSAQSTATVAKTIPAAQSAHDDEPIKPSSSPRAVADTGIVTLQRTSAPAHQPSAPAPERILTRPPEPGPDDTVGSQRGSAAAREIATARREREREAREAEREARMAELREPKGAVDTTSSRQQQRHSMFGGDTPPTSARDSISSVSPLAGINVEELLTDVHKLKVVVRQHERRIRFLEETLAERHAVDVDGLLTSN